MKNRADTAYSQYNACWPKTSLMAQVPPREIQMAAISPVSIPTSKERLSGLGAAYQNPNGHSASDARRQACCEPALELAFCINCGGACLCNLWPNLVWVWMPTG